MQRLVCLYAHVIVCISLCLSLCIICTIVQISTEIWWNMCIWVTRHVTEMMLAEACMLNCWTLWRTTLYEHQHTVLRYPIYVGHTVDVQDMINYNALQGVSEVWWFCAHAQQLLHTGTLTCKDPLNTDYNNCHCWCPAVWWCLPCWLT